MTYQKPEVILLGEAAPLILGSKGSPIPDSSSLAELHSPSDGELYE